MKIQDHVENMSRFGYSQFALGLEAHKLVHSRRMDGDDAPKVEMVAEDFDQIAIRDDAGRLITMLRAYG